MFEDYPDVVTVPQFCEMLGGMNPCTAYKLIKTGQFNCKKVANRFLVTKQSIIEYFLQD